MEDNQSQAVEHPTDGRVVKAIIYLHDCPIDCAPNAGALPSALPHAPSIPNTFHLGWKSHNFFVE